MLVSRYMVNCLSFLFSCFRYSVKLSILSISLNSFRSLTDFTTWLSKILPSLKLKSAEKLIEVAKEYGFENIGDLGRQDIIYHILKNFSDQNFENVIIGEGVMEILEDGFGFLRAPETNYFPGSDDIYVSPSQIKRFGLRTGDTIKGQIRAPKKAKDISLCCASMK